MTSTSATERPKIPAWSNDQARGNTPVRLIRSRDGTSDTMPLNAAGLPTDPNVWLPIAAGHIPAATAAADPLLEPPGVCPGFQAFRVGPGSRLAKTVVTVLPTMMAPASFSRVTACASLEGTKFSNRTEPIVVRRFFV